MSDNNKAALDTKATQAAMAELEALAASLPGMADMEEKYLLLGVLRGVKIGKTMAKSA